MRAACAVYRVKIQVGIQVWIQLEFKLGFELDLRPRNPLYTDDEI